MTKKFKNRAFGTAYKQYVNRIRALFSSYLDFELTREQSMYVEIIHN